MGVVNNQITICNIYNPHDRFGSREVVQQVGNILDMKSKCVALWDWNHTPSSVVKNLGNMDVVSYSNDAPKKGTRQRLSSLKCLKKPIDFAIENKEILVMRQRAIRKCGISYHLPIRVAVCMKESCIPVKEKLVL